MLFLLRDCTNLKVRLNFCFTQIESIMVQNKKVFGLALLCMMASFSFGSSVCLQNSTVEAEDFSSDTKDEYGVVYSRDGKCLLKAPQDLVEYKVKEGTEVIGDAAFRSCSNLTSVAIPDSVTNIGDEAFYGCSRLTSLTIPNSVTSIGEFAFQDCSSLTSITLSNSLTNINRQAIAQCRNLKSIIIPNGIISISEGAFWECSSLTSVTIPNSVTSIGQDAFQDCSKNLIIYVSKASYALDYCKKQGIKYQIQ